MQFIFADNTIFVFDPVIKYAYGRIFPIYISPVLCGPYRGLHGFPAMRLAMTFSETQDAQQAKE